MIILDVNEFIVSFFMFSFGMLFLSIAVTIFYILFKSE